MQSLYSSKAVGINRQGREYGKIVKNRRRIKTQASKQTETQTQTQISNSTSTSILLRGERQRQGFGYGSVVMSKQSQRDRDRLHSFSNSINLNNKQNLYTSVTRQQYQSGNKGKHDKYGIGSLEKYRLKSEAGLESYENKLANYEVNKRQVLRDIGRMQTNQYVNKYQPISKPYSNHFFTTKLRQSLQIHKQSCREAGSSGNPCWKESLCSTVDCSSPCPTPCPLLKHLQQQIRLQTKLRKLKLQINPNNRKHIMDRLLQFYKQYDLREIEKIVNVEFEEYECSNNNEENRKYGGGVADIGQIAKIQAQVICEGLLELYSQCQSYWKNQIFRKFQPAFVRNLFEELNFDYKVELDLKCFTRQFNIYFNKNYHSRELFRIYSRLKPLSKPHFVAALAY